VCPEDGISSNSREGPCVDAVKRRTKGSGRRIGRPVAARIAVGEQLQISRERVRQIEHEALQKLRRLDGERLNAYHQEL
jgi:hypothetical protein